MKEDKIITDEMGLEISRSSYEQTIGRMVLDYIDNFKPYELSPVAESEAVRLIAKIKMILDDDDTSDAECFHRIDEIVDAFDESGVYTHRHDW